MSDSEKTLSEDAAQRLQQALDRSDSEYVLRLYVSGTTPKSIRAITSLRRICDQYLAGRFDLKVIDIYQQPELAKHAEIVAAPTLIKTLPLPIRRIIGDLSSTERVLCGLSLEYRG